MSDRQSRHGARGAPRGADVGPTGDLPSWIESRRSFLKLAGFSFAAAMLPGCGGPDEVRAIPFLDKPEEVTPGRASWYATLCGGCTAGCGILTKNLDGRPIKVEGNPEHPISRGRTCAVGQAMVLGLYDSHRLSTPLATGSPSDWGKVDGEIHEALDAVRRKGQAVRVLTGSGSGPTRLRAIRSFLESFGDGKHVSYDPLSSSAALDAHERLFGVRKMPRYLLENAQVLVAFDADFLGPWLSPVEHTRRYGEGRSLDGADAPFSHHVQFESRVSLTGSNADRRIALAPDELRPAVEALAAALAGLRGIPTPWPARKVETRFTEAIEDVARRLHEAPRGRTAVLCGANDEDGQAVVAWVNHLLGNYRLRRAEDPGKRTLDLVRGSRQRSGDDRTLAALLEDLEAGRVGALFVDGVNPVADLPEGDQLAQALAGVPLVVSFAERADETAAQAGYVCPSHHPLEAWDDAESVEGLVTMSQPAIRPLGGTRAFVESLAAFSGEARSDYDQVRETWKAEVFPRARPRGGSGSGSFDVFWERAVHDGYVELGEASPAERTALRFSARTLRSLPSPAAPGDGVQLVLHPQTGLLDGRHANNPWLQELPDPVTKIAWDNCASIAPALAHELGVENGDALQIGVGETTIEAPALVQPGLPDAVITLALGYGRRGTERFADIGPDWIEGRPTTEPGEPVGVNAAPLLARQSGRMRYHRSGVRVRPTGRRVDLALSQIYESLDVPAHLASAHQRRRPLVHSTSLEAWRADPSSGHHPPHAFQELWTDDHPYDGHHWGLAIDLSACTGCSACVVACQAENNIPVVGKDEVRRQRDMNWIRVDRYIQGDGEDIDVRFQPMMCQQCDNAPCETVCPVLATVHSREGLNQQVYNRCVGTRYCANNCPYKARRFNWFDYEHPDQRENMVLNPAVTVRSRGVMEKCTFCVQRIEEARAEARRRGETIVDGDVTPSCAQACPAGAIVFGDTNDGASRLRTRLEDPRAYRVLGELNVRPSVGYLTRVRSREPDEGEATHG